MSRMFALDRSQATKEVRAVSRVVEQWKEHFRSEGVTRRDIELYAQHIDRPFLREQREDFAR
jgi:hypothetical protein